MITKGRIQSPFVGVHSAEPCACVILQLVKTAQAGVVGRAGGNQSWAYKTNPLHSRIACLLTFAYYHHYSHMEAQEFTYT